MLYFKLSEFIHSEIAILHNINNMPDINSIDYLLDLIFYVMQPIREHFNSPVIISSGYRCFQVNKLAGGAADKFGNPISQHCKGQACDFTVKGYSTKQVIDWCKNNLDYDQLINEYDKWVHISFVKGKNRKQYLKIC